MPSPSSRLTGLPTAWGRAALLIAGCVGLALAASSDTLHGWLLAVLTVAGTIISTHPVWGISLFIALSAVSAMLAFFSAAVIVPVAVYTWGEAASMLFLWIGWTLGGIAAYTLGRLLGRPMVRGLTASATLERLEQLLSRRVPFGLVVLFQIAVPSEVPGYLLGLMRYPFALFVLALGLAELPFAVLTVYLGASFVERRIPTLIAAGLAAALFSAWALQTLRKRLVAREPSPR